MDSKEFWTLTGSSYDTAQERYAKERYPQHIYRYRRVCEMIDAAIEARQADARGDTPLRLLDIGCGYGDILRYAHSKGMQATGIDYSASMVELAKQKLEAEQLGDIQVAVGDATDLGAFDSDSFDIVCSIQVFGYLPREKEQTYMGECHRVLRIGGGLITAEVNNIFDIATFNRFTVEFFRDHLLPLTFDKSNGRGDIEKRIAELMTKPDKPIMPPMPEEDRSCVDVMLDVPETLYASHRDQASTKAENPMDYANLMKRYGLRLDDLAFYRFHAVPPLLFESSPELEGLAESLEDKYCRSWQGHFMASSFVARSTKIE